MRPADLVRGLAVAYGRAVRNVVPGFLIVIAAACGGGDDGGGGGGECACEIGERCVDNVCTDVRYLFVGATESISTGGTFPAASGCFFKVAATDPLVVSQTEDGPCTITVLSQGTTQPTYEPRDGGQLRIEGTAQGTITLMPSAGAPGCYGVTPAPADLFSTGTRLRFVGTGGVDLPAFSAEVEAPSQIDFTAAMMPVPGQPHALTWTGAPGERTTYSLIASGSQQSTFVYCRLPDTGSFTVPASVTSRLPAGATYGQIMGRTNREHLEPEGIAEVIDVSVTTYDSVP